MADRLIASRRFVGRTAEIAIFQRALDDEIAPFAVLHLYGPGGIGKSSLLDRYASIAAGCARPVALIDGRAIDASPQGFLLALGAALGQGETSIALDRLAQYERLVLLVDTFEVLAPLDGWLREVLLPQLSAQALVVIAGRHPLSAGWRADSPWRDVLRAIPLRNLRPEESQAYLAERGVPPAQHAAMLGFTYGHPLALALVADLSAQSGNIAFHPDHAPDVVALLLERFIQDVPTPQHRMALHACATVRFLTEPLLRAALGKSDVHAIFAWLRTLTFIDQGPLGLFPHDLAREVLDSDLRWRDPEGYVALHRRIRAGIVQRILDGQGLEQMRATFDLVYLHRHNPILQPYFQWKELGSVYAEPVRPDEHAALLRTIAQFANEDAADLAEHWLMRQPEAWHIIRDTEGAIAGIFMYLALHATTPADRARDPAAAYAWEHAQRQTPLRPGDEITLARFYVDLSTYRNPTSVHNTAQLAVGLRWMTNPRLAWSFNDLFDPEHWYAMMSYYNFQRLADQRFGLYGHNWRATPVLDWLDLIGGRELASDLRVDDLAAASVSAPLVLSQPAFEEAVRSALRDFHAPAALSASPLMRSRMVNDRAEGQPSPSTLQDLLRHAAESLRGRPRDTKFLRAIEATYLTPHTTQELAAERLGVPFSTYRYQLSQGIERMTQWLWQRELYGPNG